jgi:tRNA nucleotidyltransferase (CCA-adding enzyme)
MCELNNIEKKVLKEITPNNKDVSNLNIVIKNLKKIINNEIKSNKIPAKIELVGSTAKNTYLKNNLDIDIFLLFPKSYPKIKFEKQILNIGRKILKNPEESYAEHPYIRGNYEKYKVEIVPCYKIENASQKLSAVDRTPLHTKYIKKNLSNSQRKEVRIFKQFLIGIGCYGAEADVEGFSGYLCEILILKFGNFRNLIKNASHWDYGEKFSLRNDDLNKYKFKTPLIFIDPVDNERNVSSALSKSQFKLFILACKNYLINPNIHFFFPNKIEPWNLKKIKSKIRNQEAKFIGIILPKPNIIKENLYPQIRKAVKSIIISSKRYGFKIYDVLYYLDEIDEKIFIIIKLDKKPISVSFIHNGPPLSHKENVDDFVRKWKNNSRIIKEPFIKENRIFVELKRDFVNIEDFLRYNILNLSLGKHLDKIDIKKINIVNIDKLIVRNLSCFWTEYLDGKMSWER